MRVSAKNPEVLCALRRYFIQSAELYGPELFLSNPDQVGRLEKLSEGETLASLLESVLACQACALGKTRRRFVFGTGNPKARFMLIGEAPGEEEDQQGVPFVGEAGHLLDKILQAIGFTREEVYIANILKCRPPHNRDPREEEIRACLPILEKQIQIICPALILALGRIAAQTLLSTQAPLAQLRGKEYRYGEASLFVTYHPAALLRKAELKRPTWEDVQRVRQAYDRIVGDKPTWTPPSRKS